jgi:hypothetical protein
MNTSILTNVMTIVAMLCTIGSAHSQIIYEGNDDISARRLGAEFLLRSGELGDDVTNNPENNVFCFDLVKKDPTRIDTVGIFSFGGINSPSPNYILVKYEKKYKVLDIREISKVLPTILEFLELYHVGNDDIVACLEELTKIYRFNKGSSRVKL